MNHLRKHWHHWMSIISLTLAGLILGVGGSAAVSHFTAAYYSSHYQAPLPIPKISRTISAAHVGALPPSASIHLDLLNLQNDDQGPIGSCQAWTFAKLLSYAFNWNRPHHYRLYSPRFAYDAISQGQDAGSYLEQYPPVAEGQGLPTFSQMPYGAAATAQGLPDYALEYPIPARYSQEAYSHILSLSETQLWGFTDGAGPQGVLLIKQQLATHHAVNLDFPVYPEYDQANADGSTVTMPQSGETSRGGHANTAVAYDDRHDNGDGSYGAILASNQWGWSAGVDSHGIRQSSAHNGFVWFSYSFVEQYVFDAAVLHVPSQPGLPTHAGKPIAADGGNTHLYPPPPSSPYSSPPTATSWHVSHVIITTGQDVSPLLNAAGDRYHVWPIGLAATLGVESDLNPYSERWAGGLDNSCGLAQQIISNVAYYTGIQGARAECNWEEVPANSIALEAQMYAGFIAYQHGCVTWPLAYELYNAGAGYSCGYYSSPSADVYAHEQNFLGWYSYALSHWQAGPPPPPPVFPLSLWRGYTARHHLQPISQLYRGRLSLTARIWWTHSPRAAGPIVSPPQWISRGRYVTVRFSRQRLYYWPTHIHWRPRWIRVRAIS